MNEFLRLNPYNNIIDEVDSFLTDQWETIRELIGRRDPHGNPTREINFTKPVFDSQGRYIGIIGVHCINDKFAMSNIKLSEIPVLLEKDQMVSNADLLQYSAPVLETHKVKIRVYFKQFLSEALCLSEVVFNSRYTAVIKELHSPSTDLDAEVNALIKGKTNHSRGWGVPESVIATRLFFNDIAKPAMDAWIISADDITQQTLLGISNV